jgi:hypothetical protein
MAYATNWKITAHRLGLQPIDDTSTTQQCGLGTIVEAVDRGANANGVGEFIYLKGAANTVAGSWVTYNYDDGTTTLLTTGAYGPVAVAMSANVAGQYGWYQITGKAVGKAAAGYTDNALVYATATAGTADKTVVAGSRVKEALGGSAVDFPAIGFAEFEISRPFMDNGAAA